MGNGRQHSCSVARIVVARPGTAMIESGRKSTSIDKDLYDVRIRYIHDVEGIQSANKKGMIYIRTLLERIPSI